jgi:hypothetical protein
VAAGLWLVRLGACVAVCMTTTEQQQQQQQPALAVLSAHNQPITPHPTCPPTPVHNPKWGASHPLEDCITPAWVGHSRWMLLDLTAQKSDYGPAAGGEGIVTTGWVDWDLHSITIGGGRRRRPD